MKLIIQVSLLIACISNGIVSANELSPTEARSISITAIRWLAFDEWGTRTPDNPYRERKEQWLNRLREHLKKRAGTALQVRATVADTTVLSGSYDLSKRVLETAKPQSTIRWNPKCLYIEIAPSTASTWRVALKLGSNWSYIWVARDGTGYHVASYDYTSIVD